MIKKEAPQARSPYDFSTRSDEPDGYSPKRMFVDIFWTFIGAGTLIGILLLISKYITHD
jgi:hypothetical protein